jgi:hypothetical protein
MKNEKIFLLYHRSPQDFAGATLPILSASELLESLS